MNAIKYLPPLPATAEASKELGAPFVQTIVLRNGKSVIARAVWIAETDGVVQLLHLTVDPKLGRQGHGARLLDEVIRQAAIYQKSIGAPLRRMWIMVEQKKQVIGRAFLTGQGFHHVGTMNGLYKRQDALMYMRSFN